MDDDDSHAKYYKNAKRLHNVPYISRYNYSEELEEMEGFLNEVAAAGLTSCLIGLNYDSKACVCFIETIDSFTVASPDAVQIDRIARHHIAQFELFGVIGHRGDA